MEQNQTKIEDAKMFAAVDVGTTKIVALVGYKDETGKIVVCGKSNVPSYGMWGGEVFNKEEATKAIRQAVQEARNEAGFFPGKVVVGVAGKHVRTTDHSVPRNRKDVSATITEDDIMQIRKEAYNCKFEPGERIINVIPKNYLLDGKSEVMNPVGCSCTHIDANFHVIFGRSQALADLEQCITNAGLTIVDDTNGIYLEPLASSDAVLTADERERGVAMIDIGGGTTDIAIYKGGVLCTTAVIPFGGNLITSDIAHGCNLSMSQADELKINYGEAIRDMADPSVILDMPNSSLKLSNLAGIIQARVEEILDSAAYIIGTSGYSGKKLAAGIVVTGGGSKLKNFVQLMSLKIPMASRIGTPTKSVYYAEEGFLNDPIYSTAVGLLMKSASIWEKNFKQQIVIEQEQTQTETETNNDADTPKQKRGFTAFKKLRDGFIEFMTQGSENY